MHALADIMSPAQFTDLVGELVRACEVTTRKHGGQVVDTTYRTLQALASSAPGQGGADALALTLFRQAETSYPLLGTL